MNRVEPIFQNLKKINFSFSTAKITLGKVIN